MIWVFLWAILISDSPSTNRFMSDEEKQFIHENNAKAKANDDTKAVKPPVPWKSILTSLPFWALCISHTLNNFGWYMLLVELPLFLSNGLGFNIKEV